jgi:hypothetical protein
MFGASINVPKAGSGHTYGEYMPYKGEIIGAAINLNSVSRAPGTPAAMKYYAACYGGGGALFTSELIGSKIAGVDEGSIYYNTTGANGFVTLNSLITSNTGPFNAIPFATGSYIGIFVDSSGAPTADVAIEGTLYLNIK